MVPPFGGGWIFPSRLEHREGQHVSADWMTRLWRGLEEAAGIEHRKGVGWHALRRRWVSKRSHWNPKLVAEIG